MEHEIRVKPHYWGYIVTWPAEWEGWDYRTYREKVFDDRAHNQDGLEQATQFQQELLAELEASL